MGRIRSDAERDELRAVVFLSRRTSPLLRQRSSFIVVALRRACEHAATLEARTTACVDVSPLIDFLRNRSSRTRLPGCGGADRTGFINGAAIGTMGSRSSAAPSKTGPDQAGIESSSMISTRSRRPACLD
jgi:hypothetical protein